jgi:hypothetical protein
MFEALVAIAIIAVGVYVFFKASSKGMEVIDKVVEQPIAVVDEKKPEEEPAKVVAKPVTKKPSKPRTKKTV